MPMSQCSNSCLALIPRCCELQINLTFKTIQVPLFCRVFLHTVSSQDPPLPDLMNKIKLLVPKDMCNHLSAVILVHNLLFFLCLVVAYPILLCMHTHSPKISTVWENKVETCLHFATQVFCEKQVLDSRQLVVLRRECTAERVMQDDFAAFSQRTSYKFFFLSTF